MKVSPKLGHWLVVFAVLLIGRSGSPAAESAGEHWVDVRDFGAKGDCRRVSDGKINKDSAQFVSATAKFTSKDVGQPIYILQAGAQAVGDLGEVVGAPLSSRIVAVIDSSTVTLADPARQDVSPAQACWGTDDSAAIQRAIDSLDGTGGTVYVPPGLYRVTYRGGPGLQIGVSNVHFQGSGTASAIFNSTVLFRAKMKDGRLITEQGGVPALYVGSPKKPVENVEVDHLWLGDNGQQYNYRDWGPHGWGVLGAAGKIDGFSFHDLTVETSFLCGVNMDSETKGFSIHHVTVLSSGEHGFYLAGLGSDGDVHDNRILGTTRPMRQGMAIKRKDRLRITHNEVANVDFQGICVVGDSHEQQSHDVVIADNWLHDLGSWHTEGIVVSNAEKVSIRHNRILDTSWVGISLRTTNCIVSKVEIKDNLVTRTGQMNPCFGIAVRYDAPRDLPPGSPWPGSIAGIAVANNTLTDCPSGIWFSGVGGENRIQGNRVERKNPGTDGMSYKIDALPGAATVVSDNIGVNYDQALIAPGATSQGNVLD